MPQYLIAAGGDHLRGQLFGFCLFQITPDCVSGYTGVTGDGLD